MLALSPCESTWSCSQKIDILFVDISEAPSSFAVVLHIFFPKRYPFSLSRRALMSASKPILTYFDAPGRAEYIRMAFFIADVPFEDVRFKREEWPSIQNDTRRFPNGEVPVLEVNGRVMAQSVAIGHYTGMLCNLWPKDPMEAGFVLEVMLTVEEMLTGSWGTNFSSTMKLEGDALVEGRRKFVETAQAWTCRIDHILSQSSGGFIAGASLSVADLLLYVIVKRVMLGGFPHVDRACFNRFQHVVHLVELIDAMPKVQEWQRAHPLIV